MNENDWSYEPMGAPESVQDASEPRKLFDVVVTRTVASVYSGGCENARIMAFRIIGMEETDGTYSFPDEYGRKIIVSVETKSR